MPMLRDALSRLRRSRPPDVLGAGLSALYGHAALGIATLSRDGRICRGNPAFCRMIGYETAELEGRRLDEVIHPDDRAACEEGLEGVRRGEREHFELEHRFLCKDGRMCWARIMVAGLPTEVCEGVLIAAAVDITDCRQAIDKFRSLYHRTPAMMHSIGPDGRLQTVSDRWLAGLGYGRDEVLGRPLEDFMSPESRGALRAALPTLFDDGPCVDAPYRMLRKDGRAVDVLLSAIREGEGTGHELSSLAVLVDVTERKRAEDKVRRLTAELEERVLQRTALLTAQQETSPDGILVVDPRGRILSHNRRFVEMWGIPEDVVERRCDDEALRCVLDKVADPEAFTARVAELYASRGEKSFDEVRLRDGRVFERYSSPIAGAKGRYYGRIWFFRDVSRRVERERALSEKSAQLDRSNADVEMYAFGASHDLATQVRKIANFAALLERRAGGKLDVDELGMLERVRSAAEGLSTLIKEVLALSSIGKESSPPQRVDAAAVMAELLEDLGVALLDTGARVKVGELPVLWAHRTLIYRLLENLVSNAVKYRREGVPCRVIVASRPAEGGVEIVVKDNGIGFEPRFARMIFEPFTRLHPPSVYRGHGMGLAVCQRVAARYGGRISAHGVPGKGATFVVWLPESAVARAPSIS